MKIKKSGFILHMGLFYLVIFLALFFFVNGCQNNFPIKSSKYKSQRLKGDWEIYRDTVFYNSGGLNIPMFALKSKVGDRYFYSSFTSHGEYLNMRVLTKEKIEENNQIFYLVEHLCGNFGESIDFEESYSIEDQKSLSNYDRRMYLVSYQPFFIKQFFFPSEVNNCFY